MNTPVQALSKTTISLHWIVAIFIIVIMAVGKIMTSNEIYSLYPIHKSFGAILLPIVVIRILWRIKEGWPSPVGPVVAWEHFLAKMVHWVLILGTLAFPLSGAIMSIAGGRGLEVFGVFLVAMNMVNGEVAPLNGELAAFAKNIHLSLLPIMIVAILLHVAGALKHHFVAKDATLTRMLGCTKCRK